MKISVNTAIEVVVGFEKTSGNTPRIAIAIATSTARRGRRARTSGAHCARTAAFPNSPLGRNESTTISDA